jgi:hypothetical protein
MSRNGIPLTAIFMCTSRKNVLRREGEGWREERRGERKKWKRRERIGEKKQGNLDEREGVEMEYRKKCVDGRGRAGGERRWRGEREGKKSREKIGEFERGEQV